jgi:hypothetical protein
MRPFRKSSGVDLVSTRRDKRLAVRKVVRSSAFIRLAGGFAVRPCTILDLSASGVRIAVVGAHTVPATFTLVTSRDAQGRPARVKWRRGNEIGAQFV